MDSKVDDIMFQVDTLVHEAQKRHFNAFLRAGSESYNELGKNLLSLSRVVGRVHNALKLIDEDPHIID